MIDTSVHPTQLHIDPGHASTIQNDQQLAVGTGAVRDIKRATQLDAVGHDGKQEATFGQFPGSRIAFPTHLELQDRPSQKVHVLGYDYEKILQAGGTHPAPCHKPPLIFSEGSEIGDCSAPPLGQIPSAKHEILNTLRQRADIERDALSPQKWNELSQHAKIKAINQIAEHGFLPRADKLKAFVSITRILWGSFNDRDGAEPMLDLSARSHDNQNRTALASDDKPPMHSSISSNPKVSIDNLETSLRRLFRGVNSNKEARMLAEWIRTLEPLRRRKYGTYGKLLKERIPWWPMDVSYISPVYLTTIEKIGVASRLLVHFSPRLSKDIENKKEWTEPLRLIWEEVSNKSPSSPADTSSAVFAPFIPCTESVEGRNERLGDTQKARDRGADSKVRKPQNESISKTNTRKRRADLSAEELDRYRNQDREYQRNVRQKNKQQLEVLGTEVQKNRETFSELRRLLEDSKVEEALQLLSDAPASTSQQEFPATYNMKPFE